MAYKGRSAEGSRIHAKIWVVECTAAIFMLYGLFVIWDRDQSWLQNAHIFQYWNANTKNVNASMAVERNHHELSNVAMEGDHHGQITAAMGENRDEQSNTAMDEEHHGKSNAAKEENSQEQSNATMDEDHHGQITAAMGENRHELSNAAMDEERHGKSDAGKEENHHDESNAAREENHHEQSNANLDEDHYGQSTAATTENHHEHNNVAMYGDHNGQNIAALEENYHENSNATMDEDHHGQSNAAMEENHHDQKNVISDKDHHRQSTSAMRENHHEHSNGAMDEEQHKRGNPAMAENISELSIVARDEDHHGQSNFAMKGDSYGQNDGKSQHDRVAQCNLFRGKWVYDESYILYLNGSCPFASNDFDCRKNGRGDSDHEKWRWQPDECDLPRFNASLMLEILRNKRLVYVGDSINRNQWESMLCLLRVVVPHDGGIIKGIDSGQLLQYFVKDYNCSIEFSWAPFLVRQNQNNGHETLKIDMIAEQSQHWKDSNILVFNSGHWWTHEEPYEGKNYFEEGGQVIPYMKELTAFKKALQTWAKWIYTNIDPNKTQVYFRGYSPVHFHGRWWGKKTGGGCFNETEPIQKMSEEAERIYAERDRMEIVEKVVEDMQNNVRVKLLNVTEMSMYRKDGHASVYTSKYATMTDKTDYHYADCSHWCLPGVPDVWNNILYTLL